MVCIFALLQELLHQAAASQSLHEVRMENTNLEEENSDAAAYGLVALCDSNFDNETENQVSEESVETSEIVSELGGINAVQLFIQNIQQQQQEHLFQKQQQLHSNNEAVNAGILESASTDENHLSQSEIENGNSQFIEFDPATAIAIVQEGDGSTPEGATEIDIQSLQAVAEAMEKSGVKVKVESKTIFFF